MTIIGGGAPANARCLPPELLMMIGRAVAHQVADTSEVRHPVPSRERCPPACSRSRSSHALRRTDPAMRAFQLVEQMRIRWSEMRKLRQVGVFCLRCPENRYVWVRVFPQPEDV